jgi:hypothetical protein
VAKAAASAAPHLRRYVVAAAISAAPEAENAIIEAANSKTPPFAYLSLFGSDLGDFSYRSDTINPANFSEPVDGTGVISPEQPAAQ